MAAESGVTLAGPQILGPYVEEEVVVVVAFALGEAVAAEAFVEEASPVAHLEPVVQSRRECQILIWCS
mgnify:CR=1 FL=1